MIPRNRGNEGLEPQQVGLLRQYLNSGGIRTMAGYARALGIPRLGLAAMCRFVSPDKLIARQAVGEWLDRRDGRLSPMDLWESLVHDWGVVPVLAEDLDDGCPGPLLQPVVASLAAPMPEAGRDLRNQLASALVRLAVHAGRLSWQHEPEADDFTGVVRALEILQDGPVEDHGPALGYLESALGDLDANPIVMTRFGDWFSSGPFIGTRPGSGALVLPRDGWAGELERAGCPWLFPYLVPRDLVGAYPPEPQRILVDLADVRHEGALESLLQPWPRLREHLFEKVRSARTGVRRWWAPTHPRSKSYTCMVGGRWCVLSPRSAPKLFLPFRAGRWRAAASVEIYPVRRPQDEPWLLLALLYSSTFAHWRVLLEFTRNDHGPKSWNRIHFPQLSWAMERHLEECARDLIESLLEVSQRYGCGLLEARTAYANALWLGGPEPPAWILAEIDRLVLKAFGWPGPGRHDEGALFRRLMGGEE